MLLNTATVNQKDQLMTPLDAGQIQIQSEGAECYYRRMEIEHITQFPSEILKITTALTQK